MQSNNLPNLFTQANIELNKAAVWFQVNKLTLNVSKTKYMLFRSKNMKVNFDNLNLQIGSENIERIGDDCKTKYFKFVGHRLDEHLQWDHHISHVHGKLASANYAIAQTKNYLPLNIRLTLYNSIFRSHMEFGILAWGGIALNKLKKITNLQKKCVRNVANKMYRSHSDPIFSKLGILKFDDIFKLNCSLFIHKYMNAKLPDSFENVFTPLTGSNRTNSLQVDITKSKSLSSFPTDFLPKVWNANSLHLKNITSLNSFKNNLKQSILSSYSAAVKCNSPTCPDCK